MQGILLFVSLCLSCAVFAEVKDNETLIYHWDMYHKMYYYCQFGTKEQIDKGFQPLCFRRNKNMQHILSDGTKTFPYVSYGSSFGFVLKCDDVPEADLHSCRKLLYTTCNYTCKGSNVTREMACQLRGPIENVTARWSIAQPCADSPGHSVQHVTPLAVLDNSYRKVSALPLTSVVATTSLTLSTAATNKNSAAKFTTSPVVAAATPTVAASTDNLSAKFTSPVMTAETPTVATAETPTVAASAQAPSTTLLASVITAVVAAVLVVVLIILILLYKHYQKRRRRNFRNKFEQPVSPDEKSSFENTIIAFSRTNTESTSPLMDVEGQDNLQKSSSDSETNTSIVDSDDSKIMLLLENMEPLETCFDSWDEKKRQLEIDNAAEPARPEQCSDSVSLLQGQTAAYRRNLRAQLEVISGRTREQALIGYMEQHMHHFKYQSLNELKMLEQSYERQVEEKVSDLFLRQLAGYQVKIGYIMEYFYHHKNWDAIGAILQVHKDCPYCEQFRKPRDPFVCG